jgi:hydroxyacylglutathione hydrolase
MDTNMPITAVRYTDAIYGLEQGVRCFLIVGSQRALLLDTAFGGDDLLPRIAEITDLPVTVALTHGDMDHTGGLKYFDTVYVHPAEVSRLQNLAESGITVVPMEENHVFDLGGIRLRVLHTPGHTPGSVCLLDEEHRVLYSGDTVSHGPVFLFGPGRELDLFAETLARLDGLGGFDTIYCCHGACPVGREVIGELRACAQRIADGTLQGTKPEREFRAGMAPLVYMVGESGIYYAPPEV